MQALTSAVFNLYLAIVCAFSLLAATIFAGGGISTALDMFVPAPADVPLTQYDDTAKKDLPRDPLVIKHEREERAQMQHFYDIRNMLHGFVNLMVAALVFAIHWRLFRRRVALADFFLKEKSGEKAAEKAPAMTPAQPVKKAKK